MGAIFKLEHVNIMVYITSHSYSPPRVLRQHLVEFLDMLSYSADRYLIPERGFEQWPKEIADIAEKAKTSLKMIESHKETIVVPSSTLVRILKDLKKEFASYPLYALAVGNSNEIYEEAKEIANSTMGGQLLVLIPESEMTKRNFEVLDPLPAFSTALHAAPDWPGFVFWTQTGESSFTKISKVRELLDQLKGAAFKRMGGRHFPFSESFDFDIILQDWSSKTNRKYPRLLHLSDLHFGTQEAIENQAILDSELSEIVQNVDRVVITGDLFNTPNHNYATLFTNFRNNITRLSNGKVPIAITGNHDQRMIGLFGENYKQVALIGAQKIIVDDNCQMIFICFNSSEKGALARGRITKSQFRQLGGEYHTLLAARPELKKYLPIVLVHHHPFSFEVLAETLVQRALRIIGLGDEKLLVLANSEDLHHWCMDWDIKTILHGHKHKARYVEREVTRNLVSSNLTAIGCGSSLGAEGSPVSYNLLEWEPSAQRWIASFFESINGGAFRETIVAVSQNIN